MKTIFFRNNLENPLILNIEPVKIKPLKGNETIKKFNPGEKFEGYLSRYCNSQRNSRLITSLPEDKLWEIKWKSPLRTSAVPWFILMKDDRIIIQDESGWQLFDTDGKSISNGIKYEGDISIDQVNPVFYINDPSGFISAVDIKSGKNKFLFYPYLGKGFRRSVIYSSGNKIISCGFELPIMTHNAPIKSPDLTIFELTDLGSSPKPDEDGILTSAIQVQNLLCNTQSIVAATYDSTIVLAAQDHIYFINNNLEVIKDLTDEFTPLEISLDEEMRIYLIVFTKDADQNLKTSFWILDKDGNLLTDIGIETIPNNFLTPPAIGYDHQAYIRYQNKIAAFNTSNQKLWEQFTQDPLAGLGSLDNNLLIAEGSILTYFNNSSERKFIYNFEGEILNTSPVIFNNQIFIATTNYLYCLIPK